LTSASGGKRLFGSEAAERGEGRHVDFVLWFNFVAGFFHVVARSDPTSPRHEVGHRVTPDLRDAEKDRATAHLALAQARMVIEMGRLRRPARWTSRRCVWPTRTWRTRRPGEPERPLPPWRPPGTHGVETMRAILLLMLLTSVLPALPALAADEPWVAEARSVAGAMPPKLLAVLTDAIAAGGPEGAIAVCREKAPQMAKVASEQSGWAIRRVSLRNRNPKAVPDAWEAEVLADFDRRAAAGADPTTLDRAETVVTDGKPMQRYLRALPTQTMCTACHGTPDELTPEVAARLRELYPEDLAVGYILGQIRGAVALKRALP